MKKLHSLFMASIASLLLSNGASAAVIDFENGFNNADNVTGVDFGFGMARVRAEGGINEAWIYDTTNESNGDSDLFARQSGFSHAGSGGITGVFPGNLLIIQENNDSTPDDNASGGTLFFDFSTGVTIESIDVFDLDAGKAQIFLKDIDGNNLTVNPFANALDADTANDSTVNLFETVDLGGIENVYSMEIKLQGSGAIDNIVVTSPVPEPSTYALMLGGLGLVGFMARRRKK